MTKVLGQQICPVDKEASINQKNHTFGENIDGFVNLDWCWEDNTQQLNNTRFFVTTTYDPPYDAVLGREDAIIYGMLKAP